MRKVLDQIIMIVIYSAFLGLVLWGGWNFGVVKFIPTAPVVQYIDSVVVLGLLQSLSCFMLYRVQTIHVPVLREPVLVSAEELEAAKKELNKE